MQLELEFAREAFIRAGLPVESSAFWTANPLLAIRLCVFNNRDQGTIRLEAVALTAPYSPYLSSGISAAENARLTVGLHDFQIRALASGLNIPSQYWNDFIEVTRRLYECHIVNDSLFTALEPLVLSPSGQWVVYGGTIRTDPNARFRQPLAPRISLFVDPPDGITIVPLNGSIASVINGAGLGMLTHDLLVRHGGKSSGLVDIASGSLMDRLLPALRFAGVLPGTRVVLLNIFSGLTWCVDVARSVLTWASENHPPHPLIVRFGGFDAEDGLAMISNAAPPDVYTAVDIDDAAQRAVHLANALEDS